MDPTGFPGFHIGVLGDFAVTCQGGSVRLPASRKTRALLAYLAVTGRPHRRERLCEMFWDVPDDPKGALRWSLSKLRSALGERGDELIDANRNTVQLGMGTFLLDYNALSQAARTGFHNIETEKLEILAATLRGEFLSDLSMPNCPDFEAWRVAQANHIGELARTLLTTLMQRHSRDPAKSQAFASIIHMLFPADRIPEIGESVLVATPQGASVSIPSGYNDPSPVPLAFDVRYCAGRDGARLAFTVGGSGPPLVRAPHWLSHLHFDAETPIWRHWMEAFHRRFTCLRYDERGNGLSDWNVRDLSFEAMVSDLEVVVDAAGFNKFTLLGISQGAPIAIAYAVRNPERVRRLILFGGFALGARKRGNAQEIALRDALETLLREGWGGDNPVFRSMFVHRFVPKATTEHMTAMAELQRRTMSAENALALSQMASLIDVADLLAKVTVPTLVAHCREDRIAPFEAGQALAAGIPGASFLPLESENHILLNGEPAFQQFMRAVDAFCKDA